MKKISLSLLALAAALALVPFASADTYTFPTVGTSTVPAGTALDTISGTAVSVNGPPFTVSYSESVYTYDLAGDLAFVYTATDIGGDYIAQFSTVYPALYANSATIDWISGNSVGGATVDNTDGAISLNFSPALLGSGVGSSEFVIYTTAQTYGLGTILFQDGSQAYVEGLTPTPEPGSLFLLGTGLLGLGFVVRKKLTI